MPTGDFDQPPGAPFAPPPTPEMMKWLIGKLADIEVALKTREEMARTWRGGTDEAWASAAAMHPSTAGQILNKQSRLGEAKRHTRIATRMRHDVKMYREVIGALSMAALNK